MKPLNEASELFRGLTKGFGLKRARKLVAEGGFDKGDYFNIKYTLFTQPH